MGAHGTSVAKADHARVADDVALLSRRKPAAGADSTTDARDSVTIQVPELAPWRVRVDFLVYMPASRMVDIEYEYVPVGCSLERPISVGKAEKEPESFRPDYARVLIRFVQRIQLWPLLAELKVRKDNGELERIRNALTAGTGHRYLPLLVAVYRSLDASPRRRADTAQYFNIEESTVYRGLRKALVQGLIKEHELPAKRPQTRG